MKKKNNVLFLLWIGLLIFFPAHKYYFSLTQMEINFNSKSVEVSTQIFWDDLEKALSRLENRTITYEDTAFEKLTQKYLQQHFILSKDKKIKDFQWIGFEIKKDLIVCYFEYSGITNLTGFKLTNKILTSDFPDQVNLVNIIQPFRKNSYRFQNNQQTFHL